MEANFQYPLKNSMTYERDSQESDLKKKSLDLPDSVFDVISKFEGFKKRPRHTSGHETRRVSQKLLQGPDVDSYVDTKPETSLDNLRLKSTKLIMGSNKEREKMMDLACGDEKHIITGPRLGKKAKKKIRQLKAAETKGKNWFDMKAPEMTEELKRDLQVLKMRGVVDPKRFYKKDTKGLPKYFQIGTVVDNPADYYSDRLTKKERKSTFVDELLADAEFRKYNKRKYAEILEEKSKTERKFRKRRKKQKSTKK